MAHWSLIVDSSQKQSRVGIFRFFRFFCCLLSHELTLFLGCPMNTVNSLKRVVAIVLAVAAIGPTSSMAADIPAVFTCVLRPQERVRIPAQRSGVVDTFLQVGDMASKDSVVASLRTEQLELDGKRIAAELESLDLGRKNTARTERFEAIVEEKTFELGQLKQFAKKFDLPALERTRVESELRQATADAANSRTELLQAQADYEAKLMEMAISKLAMKDSQLATPFDALVNRTLKYSGEWVQEGEAVMELVRIDELEVVVKISFDQLPPSEALGANFVVRVGSSPDAPLHTSSVTITRIQADTDVTGIYFGFGKLTNPPSVSETGQKTWQLMPGLGGTAELVEMNTPETDAI